MEPDFWRARWAQGQIGFHLAAPNPALVRCAAALGAPTRVFVPLCGKSVDLVWLAQRGVDVVGVELSPLAVEAFFAEQHLAAETDSIGPFARHRAGRVEILCGDFFELRPAHLGPIDAFYDRAALVAMPDTLRARYVEHFTSLVPAGARGLLVTFEYEPASVSGPPFSVPDAVVRALYESDFELQELERRDTLGEEPRFRERGVTALHEAVYALRRR